jgi:phosphate transport system ATP-binding protein
MTAVTETQNALEAEIENGAHGAVPIRVRPEIRVDADPEPIEVEPVFKLTDYSVWYGTFRAVKDMNIGFGEKRITSIIGPSGTGQEHSCCRSLNRMNDLIEGAHVTGKVSLSRRRPLRAGGRSG